MRSIVSTFALLAATIAAPALAHADDLFTVSPYPGTSNNQTLSFTLPSSPTAITSNANQFFLLDTGTAVVDGVSYVNSDHFYFNVPSYGGGFYDDNSNIMGYGMQLFSGTTSAPTFILGTYNLYQTTNLTLTPDYVLKITAASTPEPSSLVLLGTGVLGLAGAARRRLSK